jgi:hypothetical protein
VLHQLLGLSNEVRTVYVLHCPAAGLTRSGDWDRDVGVAFQVVPHAIATPCVLGRPGRSYRHGPRSGQFPLASAADAQMMSNDIWTLNGTELLASASQSW